MRRLVLYGVIVFQIILIVSLIRGIQLSRESSKRIVSMEETKAKLLSEQEKLKQEKEYVQSQYYLEKIARDELHLSKEGERVVIIPEGVIVQNMEQGISDNEKDKPNWQKWWEVLSGQR